MNLTLVTAPAEEPITLAEAKAHLKIDIDDEDALVSALIVAAREYVEAQTGRALVTQIWEQSFRGFREAIRLAKPPLQSVTSVSYIDDAGDTQTLSTGVYTVDVRAVPGGIALAYGQSWPTLRDQPNNVVVRFAAGYGAATAVPQALKQAMLLLVGHWYANREAVNIGNITSELPLAVPALLTPYRIWLY